MQPASLRSTALALLFTSAAATSPAAAQGSVQFLGTLGGSANATDVSADGEIVVGWSNTSGGCKPGNCVPHAFRWDPATGMQDLGTLHPGPFPNGSRATGVSADGSIVVGSSRDAALDWRVFRWDAVTGMRDLGTLGGSTSFGEDVSADGSIVVGTASTALNRTHAFRWDAAAGMQDLGTLGGDHSWATAVSADGQVVVGWSMDGSGAERAFRWTAPTGMQDLGPISAIDPAGVNADGSIVMGTAVAMTVGAVPQVVVWRASTGVVGLGIDGYGNDINDDGSVVVGECLACSAFGNAAAFRWTAGEGLRILLSNQGSPSSTGVSSNGSVVVGDGGAWRWTSTEVGARYCTPAANSTGRGSLLNVLGSDVVTSNDITLAVEFLPQGSFGYFLASRDPGAPSSIAGSAGLLCLGGFIGRFVGPGQVLDSGATGTFSLPIDLSAMPTPFGAVAVQPGETWSFQAWHRDADPTPTSNFSDAVSVVFQ